jgi:hypothetical protein
LPAALAIAEELPATGFDSKTSLLCNIAFHLAADNPTGAERVLDLVPRSTALNRFPPAIAWKMASADPARARRLTDQSEREREDPQRYLFLALGLKSRDPAAATQAFRTAMHGIDRVANESGGYSSVLGGRDVLLPMVEQIDPALVPEYFWRVVAARPSIGDPRTQGEMASASLALLLAWYDRQVAAVVLEPLRSALARTDDRDLAGAGWAVPFQAWSILDPRAAAARLAQMPIAPTFDSRPDIARQRVAQLLALPREARWRNVWLNNSKMADILLRDL